MWKIPPFTNCSLSNDDSTYHADITLQNQPLWAYLKILRVPKISATRDRVILLVAEISVLVAEVGYKYVIIYLRVNYYDYTHDYT